MPLLRSAARLGLALGLLVVGTPPAYAADSPQGDVAVSWPVGWSTYRNADGTAILDALGDENPDNADLSSGCTTTGCTGTSPTVYYASDGTNAFFRIRIAVDPADASKGGLTGNAYLTQIAVGGTVVAVAGVDGKSASVDYVYVASAPGTTVTQIYTYPFTSTSSGMRVVSDGADAYFLDYQVPISRLTAISGGAITSTTPVQLYYGSSAAANLATLNKDLMRGATSTVSFTGLATVSFSTASLSATSGAVAVNGSTLTENVAKQYTVTWTASNGGGGELSGATASATLPAGVTFVSGPGVSASGSTVTWNPGLLLPGETDSVSFVVSVTPASGTGGTSVPLLSALSASGTDVGTGTARTATAPALTAGPVAAAPPPPPPPPPTNSPPTVSPDTLTVAEDGSGGVNVLANDSDPDGNPLTVTVTGGPSNGATSVAGGVVTYTPDAEFSGTDTFTYTACDPSAACASTTVTVTVTPVNDPPGGLAGASYSTPEDAAVGGTLPDTTDVDDATLTHSAVTQPSHGAVTVDPDGSFTYTPDANYNGPDSFTFQVCDAGGLCSQATATVTVTPVNDAPVAAAPAAASTPEDTPIVSSVPAGSDVDGDGLAYALGSGATHGTVVVNPDGSYTYTPDANYNGPDSFTYTVCDAGPLCDTSSVTLSVTPVNDAPVAAGPVAASTPEDTPLAATLPAGSDVDGDALAYALGTGPAHGTVVVNPDGSYTYTPDANYNGADSFTYTVCDAGPLCDSSGVTLTVTSVNDAPVAAATATASTPEDTPLTSALPTGSDVDGDPLTYALGTGATHGTVVVNPDGTYTYTPDAGYNGPDSFTYTVCDAASLCDTSGVTLTVTPVNDAPSTPAAVTFTTPQDTAHGGTLPSATDPDGDALTYGTTTAPAHGSVTVGPDGTYLYTPAPGYSGPDSWGYEVCDATACAGNTVSVTVTPAVVPPVAPVAEDDVATTAYGAPVVVDVLANDTVSGPAVVTLGGTPQGTPVYDGGVLTYTPPSGFSGTDTFTYTVCDESALCDSATVTMTVQPKPNTPPVADAGSDRHSTGSLTVHLDGTGSSDADGDTLTYAWTQVSGPPVTLAGADTATPEFHGLGAGTYVFRLTVSDGTATDTGDVTVELFPPHVDPGPPACDDESVISGPGGVTVTIDCDGPGDRSLGTPPAHGDAVVADDGTIRYVPDAGYTGPDTFTVWVCYGLGCTKVTVTVDVRNGVVRRPTRLPSTGGGGVDTLLPTAFVLILAGAATLRRGARATA
jgi:VCBS repeat-containing protein